jgi:hypothetical protein
LNLNLTVGYYLIPITLYSICPRSNQISLTMRLFTESLATIMELFVSLPSTVAAPILLNGAGFGVHTHPILAIYPNVNLASGAPKFSSVAASSSTPRNVLPILVTVDTNGLLRPENTVPGGPATESNPLWDAIQAVEQLIDMPDPPEPTQISQNDGPIHTTPMLPGTSSLSQVVIPGLTPAEKMKHGLNPVNNLPAAPPGFTIVKRLVTTEGKALFPPLISISHGASSPRFTKCNLTSEETAYAEVILQDVQKP